MDQGVGPCTFKDKLSTLMTEMTSPPCLKGPFGESTTFNCGRDNSKF